MGTESGLKITILKSFVPLVMDGYGMDFRFSGDRADVLDMRYKTNIAFLKYSIDECRS